MGYWTWLCEMLEVEIPLRRVCLFVCGQGQMDGWMDGVWFASFLWRLRLLMFFFPSSSSSSFHIL